MSDDNFVFINQDEESQIKPSYVAGAAGTTAGLVGRQMSPWAAANRRAASEAAMVQARAAHGLGPTVAEMKAEIDAVRQALAAKAAQAGTPAEALGLPGTGKVAGAPAQINYLRVENAPATPIPYRMQMKVQHQGQGPRGAWGIINENAQRVAQLEDMGFGNYVLHGEGPEQIALPQELSRELAKEKELQHIQRGVQAAQEVGGSPLTQAQTAAQTVTEAGGTAATAAQAGQQAMSKATALQKMQDFANYLGRSRLVGGLLGGASALGVKKGLEEMQQGAEEINKGGYGGYIPAAQGAADVALGATGLGAAVAPNVFGAALKRAGPLAPISAYVDFLKYIREHEMKPDNAPLTAQEEALSQQAARPFLMGRPAKAPLQ
jgi:hypothetical protein